jgi:hypothetical protein
MSQLPPPSRRTTTPAAARASSPGKLCVFRCLITSIHIVAPTGPNAISPLPHTYLSLVLSVQFGQIDLCSTPWQSLLTELTGLTGLWRDKSIRYHLPSPSLLRQVWHTMAMFAVFAMIAGFWGNRLYICVFDRCPFHCYWPPGRMRAFSIEWKVPRIPIALGPILQIEALTRVQIRLSQITAARCLID